jgi:hypothetical protein
MAGLGTVAGARQRQQALDGRFLLPVVCRIGQATLRWNQAMREAALSYASARESARPESKAGAITP